MIENFNFLEVLYGMLSFINTNYYLVLAFIIVFSISFVLNRVEKEKRMNKIDSLLDLIIEEKELNNTKNLIEEDITNKSQR
jgi:hypothetical protein